jgi:hypothetical protein
VLHTWKPVKAGRLTKDKKPLKTLPLKPLPTHVPLPPPAPEPVPRGHVPAVPAALLSVPPRIQAVVQEASSQLLGFLSTPTEYEAVQVTDIDAKSLWFHSPHAYKANTALNTRLAVPLLAVGNSIVVDVRATVQKCDEADKGYEIQARFKDLPPRLRPLLEKALEQERRKAARFKRAFQVVSRDLPGYRAISVDVSAVGIGLNSAADVPIGSSIELWLDLDDTPTPGESPTRRMVLVRIVHSTQQIDNRYRIGAEFEGMSDSVAAALFAYLKRTT